MWDRAKKLTPKVGDKFEELGQESWELRQLVMVDPDTDSGAYFGQEDVPEITSRWWEAQWRFAREVRAITDGEVTEWKIHCSDYKGPNPDGSTDYGDPLGSDFVVRGRGAARTLEFFPITDGFGIPRSTGPAQQEWLQRKFQSAEPDLLATLDALLPAGIVTPNKEWTVDLARLSKAAFGGVALTGGSIKGALRNVRDLNGMKVGDLEVNASGVYLARDPLSGAPWRQSEYDRGKVSVQVEGIVRVDGSPSLDGATHWNQLSVGVGYEGTTAMRDVVVRTPGGLETQKHNVQIRSKKRWSISFEKKG